MSVKVIVVEDEETGKLDYYVLYDLPDPLIVLEAPPRHEGFGRTDPEREPPKCH